MKKQIRFVYAFALILVSLTQSNGQFADAVMPQYGYNSFPVLSERTGNDIHLVNGVNYEVAVFDNQSNDAFLGWKVGSATGYASLGSGNIVNMPDVCLVKNNSNQVFAIVVYFDVTTEEIKMMTYQWAAGAQSFNLVSQAVVSVGFVANTLQIGSDDAGAFGIVWDDPNEQIYLAFGQATGSSQPALLQGGQSFALDTGVQPDVCVFYSSANFDRQVNVVYVNSVGVVAADGYSWSDLVNGIINPIVMYRSPNADLQYNYPKIACPPSAWGKKEDFTIVTEDTDNNSIWYIKGFNKNFNSSATIDQFIYNNGSNNNSPWNISTVPNTRPVVAYDHLYETIWVSWNVDNSFGLLNAPSANFGKFPIAICGSKRAGIQPGASYLYVPTGSLFGNTVDVVSLSGHKSNRALFTFNDKFASQSYSKSIPHTANAPTLRNGPAVQTFHGWIEQIIKSDDNQSAEIDVIILDLSGRQILQKRLPASKAIEFVKSIQADLSSGSYILQSRSKNSPSGYSGLITCIGQ